MAEADSQADFARAITAIAQTGDRDAFAALFAYFAPRIKTFMLRAGANPSLAEELAQETLLAVWRKADRFNPTDSSPSGWIFTIARNLRIDRIRREKSLPEDDPSLQTMGEDGPPPDALLEANERERQVRLALAQLPAEQLQVVKLSFFEDKPHGEIAAELSIPLGTVKSRLRLATARLRQLLGDELS